MSTLFISDLHLNPNNPVLIQLAVDFLDTKAKHCEALYILGDLFDVWLGDDIIPKEFTPIIERLQQLHQSGIRTYLMVGNRDFMLGEKFARLTGCERLNDDCVIDLYGTQTLLLHGDTLCTDDTSYQRYRLWSRSRVIKWCFLHLPMTYRQNIVHKIKQKSHQQKQQKSAMIMDVNNAEVRRIMTKFGVSQLIHGHTHRPAIHSLTINGEIAKRIVLGDWLNEISYLDYNDQQVELFDPRIN